MIDVAPVELRRRRAIASASTVDLIPVNDPPIPARTRLDRFGIALAGRQHAWQRSANEVDSKLIALTNWKCISMAGRRQKRSEKNHEDKCPNTNPVGWRHMKPQPPTPHTRTRQSCREPTLDALLCYQSVGNMVKGRAPSSNKNCIKKQGT